MPPRRATPGRAARSSVLCYIVYVRRRIAYKRFEYISAPRGGSREVRDKFVWERFVIVLSGAATAKTMMMMM